MTSDDSIFEQELRQLFTSIPPPPAPVSWRRGEPAARDARTPRRFGRPRPLIWRVATIAAVAVAVGGIFVFAHRDTSVSAITVVARPAAADLSCRLPISALSSDHTTGFIVLDHGRATFEAARTGGTTYVPALRRWVEALPQLVAPDGRSYVTQRFSGPATTIHVIDATADRTVLTTGAPLNVFAFTPAGILLIDMSRGPTGPPTVLNLKLLDPASGVLRPFPYPPPAFGSRGAVSSAGASYLRSTNAIWLTAYFIDTNSTTVTRYDLATGATTQWFDGRTDGQGHVEVVGADPRGLPIVQLADKDLFHTSPAQRAGIRQRTLVLTSPHQATVLNQGRVGDAGVAGNLSPLSVTEGDRVWLAADDGTIWTDVTGSGLQQVAKVTTSTAGPPGVAISGPCR
jgi:hypothetical protein